MRVGGKDRGTWYSDAQIIDIRTRAFEEAKRYAQNLEVQKGNLEKEVATLVAEKRAMEDELARVREQLKTAELFIPLAERIAYGLAMEEQQGPPVWEGSD